MNRDAAITCANCCAMVSFSARSTASSCLPLNSCSATALSVRIGNSFLLRTSCRSLALADTVRSRASAPLSSWSIMPALAVTSASLVMSCEVCALKVAVTVATCVDDTRATMSPFLTRSPLRTGISRMVTGNSLLIAPASPTTIPSARLVHKAAGEVVDEPG